MKYSKIAIFISTALFAVPAMADNLPFVGKWAGGPATCATPFRFTRNTYTPPGGAELKIKGMKRDGSDFNFRFADGYSISVMNVRRNSMTWTSLSSGETFDLTRCK